MLITIFLTPFHQYHDNYHYDGNDDKYTKPHTRFKIPVTTEQELNSTERNSITPIVTGFIFFNV